MNKALTYEMGGSPKVKDVKGARKYGLAEALKEYSIPSILGYVFVRTVWPHRFKIAAAYIVYRTVLDIFPPANDVIISLVQSVF